MHNLKMTWGPAAAAAAVARVSQQEPLFQKFHSIFVLSQFMANFDKVNSSHLTQR